MKKTFLMLTMSMLCFGAMAQNNMTYEDESVIGDAYASSGDTARVIIRCHDSMPLTFSSRVDGGPVEPFRVTKEGSYNLYDFHFPTDSYDDELRLLSRRVLVVFAKDHNNLEIKLPLVSKQCVKLRIWDPDDNKLNSPYIRFRNEAFEEYKNMNYQKARQLFVQAGSMSDADQAEAVKNVNMVDSVIYFRQLADKAFEEAKFMDAYKYYNNVLSLNNDDSYALDKKQESTNHYRSICDIAYQKAEYLFSEKQYEEARAQYQIMVDEKCYENFPIYSTVEGRLNFIDDIIKSRKSHATVITYEWRKDTPLGLHIGKYKDHKWGGFFQFDLNTKIFEMSRSNAKFGDKPEANISFGWTVKLVKPLWLFFGPGATAKMYHGMFADGKYPGDDYAADKLEKYKKDYLDSKEISSEDYLKKVNSSFAISPVIGFLVKYSYFAVRVTYQYRFSLKKELEDFMGKSYLSFGVGLAF